MSANKKSQIADACTGSFVLIGRQTDRQTTVEMMQCITKLNNDTSKTNLINELLSFSANVSCYKLTNLQTLLQGEQKHIPQWVS